MVASQVKRNIRPLIRSAMNNVPIVSILTTIYNREKYLSDCIESVLSGEFQDFELILVDDCSTDRSWDIAQHYADLDPRIKAFRNETNLGDYPNRNKAASLASGKYLKYLDADDMHGKFLLNIMVEAMEQWPQAVLGIYNRRRYEFEHHFLTPQEAYKYHHFDGVDILHSPPLYAIIRRDEFMRAGSFQELPMTGDLEMWHRLTATYGLLVIAQAQTMYRVHDDQQFKTMIDPVVGQRYLLKTIEVLRRTDCPLAPVQTSQKLTRANRNLARGILYAFTRYGIGKAQEMKTESKLKWHQVLRLAFS